MMGCFPEPDLKLRTSFESRRNRKLESKITGTGIFSLPSPSGRRRADHTFASSAVTKIKGMTAHCLVEGYH